MRRRGGSATRKPWTWRPRLPRRGRERSGRSLARRGDRLRRSSRQIGGRLCASRRLSHSFAEGRIDGARRPSFRFPRPPWCGWMRKAASRSTASIWPSTNSRARRALWRSHFRATQQLHDRRTRRLRAPARRGGPVEPGCDKRAASDGAAGSSQAVYCTNPIAFAAPGEGRPALVIDQSSSATAFVKIREAAARGETLPEGWAIDADGAPTTDPCERLRARS